MPIFQAPLLFFLLAGIGAPGLSQAAGDPTPATVDRMPASAGAERSPEPLAPAEDEALEFPSDSLSLSAPDILVDLPYIYPLLRMRLTPEMRQGPR